MPTFRDDAVVLARLDFSESSQILALFSRDHGKIRAIAKGIKRGTKARFAVGVDLLDVGKVSFAAREAGGETLATITEWKQSLSLSGLREKLSSLNAALYAAEITSFLTMEWDAHDGLYDMLVTTLHALNAGRDGVCEASRYQRVLLEAAGSLPRFDVCVGCGRSQDLTHFSSFQGGMLCSTCEPRQSEKHPVSSQTLTALQSGEIPEGSSGAFRLLNYHISHLAGREPRLASLLAGIPARSRRG